MTTRKPIHRPGCFIVGLALALWVLPPSGLAETIRVTTWNLQAVPPRPNGAAAHAITNRIQEAAAALKQLDPDIILLQQVRSWWMCDQLVRALKPATYHVVVCSAFKDPRTGTVRGQQVAILAKEKGYFSWTESWRSPDETPVAGGFAFAAVRIRKQRIGVFSVEAPTVPAGKGQKQPSAAAHEALLSDAVEQVLVQVGSVSKWVANRVKAFVVGGTFGPAVRPKPGPQTSAFALLEMAGFGDAFADLPAGERATTPGRAGQHGATADYLFSQAAASSPSILHVQEAGHYPLTCEIEPGLALATARAEHPVQAAPVHKAQEKPVPANASALPPSEPVETTLAPSRSQPSTLHPQLLLLIAGSGGTLVILGLVWILVRRRRSLAPKEPALLTEGNDMPSSYTFVASTRSGTETSSARPPPPPPQPIIQVETAETHTEAEILRRRALAAEHRAERANAVIRNRLLPQLSQWLKQGLARKLVADRASLLETQQTAARKALAVEQRLARIEDQLQRQNASYQVRIEELTRELIVAKEENRELIRARIAQVKAEMEAARARLIAQTEAADNDDVGV